LRYGLGIQGIEYNNSLTGRDDSAVQIAGIEDVMAGSDLAYVAGLAAPRLLGVRRSATQRYDDQSYGRCGFDCGSSILAPKDPGRRHVEPGTQSEERCDFDFSQFPRGERRACHDRLLGGSGRDRVVRLAVHAKAGPERLGLAGLKAAAQRRRLGGVDILGLSFATARPAASVVDLASCRFRWPTRSGRTAAACPPNESFEKIGVSFSANAKHIILIIYS
jgi:hypothetical protein